MWGPTEDPIAKKNFCPPLTTNRGGFQDKNQFCGEPPLPRDPSTWGGGGKNEFGPSARHAVEKNHGDGGESCIHRGVLSLNKLGNPNFPARFAHSREIGIRPFGGLLGGYPQIPDKVFPLKNTACLQFLAIGILITMRLPPPP